MNKHKRPPMGGGRGWRSRSKTVWLESQIYLLKLPTFEKWIQCAIRRCDMFSIRGIDIFSIFQLLELHFSHHKRIVKIDKVRSWLDIKNYVRLRLVQASFSRIHSFVKAWFDFALNSFCLEKIWKNAEFDGFRFIYLPILIFKKNIKNLTSGWK